jgi:hypothetical protein
MSVMSYNGAAIIGTRILAFFFRSYARTTTVVVNFV